MALVVAVQMDPPEALNAASDSTVVLMEEAQRRGYSLYYYHPSRMFWADGVVYAPAQPITLITEGAEWFRLGEPTLLDLAQVDVVLMRQDPPYDMAYLSATYLLSRITAQTLVVNNPCAVRNLPEKLFPLDFAAYMPPTIIASEREPIEDFLRLHGDIVLKPLYGHGGHAVFRLRQESENLQALLEFFFRRGDRPVIAQKFLSDVAERDLRVLMIAGRVEGVIGRLPASGEVRSNMRVGGTPVRAELNAKQQEICDAIGEALMRHGILFAGLDLIGDWLTEINITSPTGLRAAKNLYGTSPESVFWDAVALKLLNKDGIVAEPIV